MALATALAACSGAGDTLSELKFSKTADLFTIKTADSAVLPAEDSNFSRRGVATPEQMVDAAGNCAFEAPQPAEGPAATGATAPQAAAAMPADPTQPQLLGGIALGMTECEVVRRAGQPGNVTISADGNGDRLVVLTYPAGNFPGIYRFTSGRLKVVERGPEPPKPEKPVRKRAKPKPKTAAAR